MLRAFVQQMMKNSNENLKGRIVRSQLWLKYDMDGALSFKVADTREELEASFRLLHDSYVEERYMEPHPSGMRVLFYHALPSTTTLVVKHHDEVVGTIALIRDNPLGLPLEGEFDLTFLRKSGVRIGETSSFAIKRGFRGQQGVIFPMLKFAMEYARDYFGMDVSICAVNPKQNDFFDHILLHQPIGEKMVGNYGFANGAPAVAKYLDLRNLPVLFAKTYGKTEKKKNLFTYLLPERYGGTDFENFQFPDRQYFNISDPIMKPKLLQEFFLERTDVLLDLAPEQRQLVKTLYNNWDVVQSIHVNGESEHRTGERRHEVQCRGMVSSSKEKTDVLVNVVNVSRNGLAVKSPLPLKFKKQYKIRVSLSPFHVSSLCIQAVWQNENKGCLGFVIVESDSEWDYFITNLDSQFEVRRVSKGK